MNEFEKWLSTRPKIIQEMGSKYPPNIDYGMNNDGDVYRIFSYFENGTVSVLRYGCGINLPMWKVAGVDPVNLYPLT